LITGAGYLLSMRWQRRVQMPRKRSDWTEKTFIRG
jgi:hypothetical protein